MSQTKPPNILFLMSDQHRPDVTGYEGNDVVLTPTLDWLASGGVVFRNAYTPSPICIPGRQCLMAGQLPRTCGVQQFGQDLPPFSMTFPRVFSQYAYEAACVGKLHHTGPDQMQGWTARPFGDMHVTDRHRSELTPEQAARYKPEPGTGKWNNQKEIERSGIAEGTYQSFDAMTIEATERLIRLHFLDPEYDRPKCHRPTLLKCSLIQPHYPFFTDRENFEYYLNRVPIYRPSTEQLFDHPVLSRTQYPPPSGVVVASERDIRRATAAYYGMVQSVDEHFATVLEALEHAGEDLDEWIIVYTSDHGEMLGQHRVWEKTSFFEASARVPLIIRWPQRFEPRVVTENVNLCDLFATLCELAGLPLPAAEQTVNGAGLDSRSLVPLMSGQSQEWRSRYHNESISQFAMDRLMIKRDDLKYQHYGAEHPEVLFDLASDPQEKRNVAGDARYADRIAEFRQRAAELGYGPNAHPNYRNAGY